MKCPSRHNIFLKEGFHLNSAQKLTTKYLKSKLIFSKSYKVYMIEMWVCSTNCVRYRPQGAKQWLKYYQKLQILEFWPIRHLRKGGS